MSNRHRVEPCPTVELHFDGQVEHVDAGIATLVDALNRLPGIRTVGSCEGHPWSPCDTRAYVGIAYYGVDIEIRLWPDLVPTLVERLTQHKDG
jgi:hypothetical protein